MSPPETAQRKGGLLRSTAVFSAMTLLSRIAGFARDVVQAHVFGAGGIVDAFAVAYRIPNYLRRIFAEGSFASAFVLVPGFSALARGWLGQGYGLQLSIVFSIALNLGLALMLFVMAPDRRRGAASRDAGMQVFRWTTVTLVPALTALLVVLAVIFVIAAREYVAIKDYSSLAYSKVERRRLGPVQRWLAVGFLTLLMIVCVIPQVGVVFAAFDESNEGRLASYLDRFAS